MLRTFQGPSILVYIDKLKLNLTHHELWKVVPCVIDLNIFSELKWKF